MMYTVYCSNEGLWKKTHGFKMFQPSPGQSLVRQVRNAAWYITWQRRDDAACGLLRYELRVQERGRILDWGGWKMKDLYGSLGTHY